MNQVVNEIQITYKNTLHYADRKTISSSESAYSVLKAFYNPETIDHREESWALYMNTGNQVLAVLQISLGGITGTNMDVRVIFQAALKLNATTIVISHNHPSGNLMPSDADRATTKRIEEAAKVLDMRLLDHLIITSGGYRSFADKGDL